MFSMVLISIENDKLYDVMKSDKWDIKIQPVKINDFIK